MSPSRTIRSSVSILWLTIGTALSSSLQVQPSAAQPVNEIKTEETRLYADARPYLDATLAELTKTVHELGGCSLLQAKTNYPIFWQKLGRRRMNYSKKCPIWSSSS